MDNIPFLIIYFTWILIIVQSNTIHAVMDIYNLLNFILSKLLKSLKYFET